MDQSQILWLGRKWGGGSKETYRWDLFQVLMMVRMMTVFWDVAPYSLGELDSATNFW
jgi:hypothetical protein